MDSGQKAVFVWIKTAPTEGAVPGHYYMNKNCVGGGGADIC